MGKKVQVSNQDRAKSYFKYYEQGLFPADPAKFDVITEEPYDNALAVRIEDRNRLFQKEPLEVEAGWWVLENGTAIAANSTFFPGTTGEMYDWWLVWHPQDRLRYAIWDCEDHYDVHVEDPERLKDSSLSLRERYWGSVHHLWESMLPDTAPDLIRLEFLNPADAGYDTSLIDTDQCCGVVCGNGSTCGHDMFPDLPTVFTHLMIPVEGGTVFRTRFWIGYQLIDGKPVKCIPDGIVIPPFGPKALVQHNIREFNNLAHILPALYEEEKDNL